MISIDFLEEDMGAFWVYEEPDPAEEYCIGGDFAEGKVRSRGAGSMSGKDDRIEPDYNAFSVIKVSTGEEVCTYMSKYAPFMVATDMVALGLHYGPASGCDDLAFLVPEINGPGLAVIERIREMGYPRMFITRRWLKFEDRFEASVGWRTDERTRAVMLTELQREVFEQDCGVNCLRTARHMAAMRYGRTGKAEAPHGEHDDLAFARMLAMQGRKQLLMEGGDRAAQAAGDEGEELEPGVAADRTDRMWQELASSQLDAVDSQDDEDDEWIAPC